MKKIKKVSWKGNLSILSYNTQKNFIITYIAETSATQFWLDVVWKIILFELKEEEDEKNQTGRRQCAYLKKKKNVNDFISYSALRMNRISPLFSQSPNLYTFILKQQMINKEKKIQICISVHR